MGRTNITEEFTPSKPVQANMSFDFRIHAPVDPTSSTCLSMFIILPAMDACAAERFVSGDVAMSIQRRTGSRLTAGNGTLGETLLRIYGTPIGNAGACFLIQEALWLAELFAVQSGVFGTIVC